MCAIAELSSRVPAHAGLGHRRAAAHYPKHVPEEVENVDLRAGSDGAVGIEKLGLLSTAISTLPVSRTG